MVVSPITKKVIVCATAAEGASPPIGQYSPTHMGMSVAAVNTAVISMIFTIKPPEKMLSPFFTGGFCMMSGSARSRQRLKPGMPSHATLMMSSCNAVTGDPQPKISESKTMVSAEKLQPSME